MPKLHSLTFSITLSLSWLLLSSLRSEPAWAGRPIFNQTPQAIEHHFGHYQTRLTTPEGVVYTYSPQGLRRLFPKFPQTRWSITYVNNRAKFINVDVSANSNVETFTYNQPEAAKLFRYLLGYEPPTWLELSRHFSGNETIYDYEYCLGDGVATSFTRLGYMQFTEFMRLYYTPRCEPPYRQGQFER